MTFDDPAGPVVVVPVQGVAELEALVTVAWVNVADVLTRGEPSPAARRWLETAQGSLRPALELLGALLPAGSVPEAERPG